MKEISGTIRSGVKFLLWSTTGKWETRQSKESWDREFLTGHWRCLESIGELGHYSLIVGYASALAPKTILDVCCGQGVLAGHLKSVPYLRYQGIDFSSDAVVKASDAHSDVRTSFSVADAREFESEEQFDLIVFNECLYYFRDPAQIIRNYAKNVAPNGRIIISMFSAPENMAVWRLVQHDLVVEDAVTVKNHNSSRSWTVKCLAPGVMSKRKLSLYGD
jgi:2-polyprenyl-3-methyl-5-hydroxy-6-metoxy-1,4-benzoquinol methylase